MNAVYRIYHISERKKRGQGKGEREREGDGKKDEGKKQKINNERLKMMQTN